jgi:hypothetical protein
VPTLLKRLGDERFDGSVTVLSHPHVLQLVLVEGHILGASLTSGSDLPALEGDAALRGWTQRTEPDAGTRSQLGALDRPIAECLSAAVDGQPDVTPLASVGQLREALRHLATVSHHGLVDVTTGVRWGRVLFSHGQVLGAYESESPALVASLAGIGPLAAADDAIMTVRTVRSGARPWLVWPLADAIVEPSPAPQTEVPVDTERDERIESDLLWLFSDVDRDRERASRSSTSDAQLLQVLASFANSVFAMAAELASNAETPRPVPQVAESIRELAAQHALLADLPMKGDRIDASALGKRCRSMPSDGPEAGARLDYFANGCRALLALARHGISHVTAHMSSPAVALRCATALEACMISIELELPSRRFRVAS